MQQATDRYRYNMQHARVRYYIHVATHTYMYHLVHECILLVLDIHTCSNA